MTTATLEQLKFPVGRFKTPKVVRERDLTNWISTIERFPSKLAAAVGELDVDQLHWRYRPDGWMIKQVVHHCADSHINSLTRFKLALTEDNPTIRPYLEEKWAEMPDGLLDDLSPSLSILSGVHHRWTVLLKNLNGADFERTFVHPEHGHTSTLEEAMAQYDWHCDHHLAHVKQAVAAKGIYNL